MNKREIAIKTPYIKLDQFLKFVQETHSGGEAKILIESGRILVNGESMKMRGKKIRPGDVVTGMEGTYQVVASEDAN